MSPIPAGQIDEETGKEIRGRRRPHRFLRLQRQLMN